MPMYIDVKRDLSLYNRFYEAVKILATETGSLNDRLFKAYWSFLFAISSSHFKEKELQEKLKYVENIFSSHFKEKELQEKLKYVENIFHNEHKCTYYKYFEGEKLHCHWKESVHMAENIFQIYDYIIESRCENDR